MTIPCARFPALSTRLLWGPLGEFYRALLLLVYKSKMFCSSRLCSSVTRIPWCNDIHQEEEPISKIQWWKNAMEGRTFGILGTSIDFELASRYYFFFLLLVVVVVLVLAPISETNIVDYSIFYDIVLYHIHEVRLIHRNHDLRKLRGLIRVLASHSSSYEALLPWSWIRVLFFPGRENVFSWHGREWHSTVLTWTHP